MSRYKTIAVIYGSDTTEWEVACRSGEYTASRIDESSYDVYEIFARFGKWSLVACRKKDSMRFTFPEEARPQIDKNDFSVTVYGEKVTFDFVYIMQHGSPGENGLIQGYFEMLGIPFSTCSAFTSAVVFDKYSCKCYLRGVDYVKFAPDAFIRKGTPVEPFCEQAVARLGLPLFVKPTGAGSSFGITRVSRAEDLADAIGYAFSESPTVILEKAISGREFTCAAYRDASVVKTLPIIEIVSENEYFDYEAKYNGHSREICPAPIPETHAAAIRDVTARLYEHLGCRGVVRMDYIQGEDGLYFLEVNTIPGMTNASLVPKMVRAAGMDMTRFLSILIENA